MSVRAYKIITKELADSPSFNLWRDVEFLEELENEENANVNWMDNGTCYIEATAEAIKNAVSKFGDKYLNVLEDVKGLNDDNWIEYECY